MATSWLKAIKFTVVFCVMAYIGGAMLMLGGHQMAKMVGVSVVIAVDENAGGEQ